MIDFLEIREGNTPLVLSMPHGGQELIPGLAERLSPTGRGLGDTDWWIERVYDFAGELDVSLVRTRLSRTVIDVNRDPSGASLYPGQAATGLCPTESFDGEPLYQVGAEPIETEVAQRRQDYFAPYHAALREQIARVKAAHGFALLYDCHSIRSRVPRLFPGDLPVFNIGTNGGESCAPQIETAVAEVCAEAEGYSHVVNGRFKGGWITRNYGKPGDGVHAIQMELAQRAYMEENPPWTFDETKAGRLRSVLRRVLEAMLARTGDMMRAGS